LSSSVELFDYGERAFLVQSDDGALTRRLAAAAARWTDLQEIVPGHRTLLLAWTGDRPDRDELQREITALLDTADPEPAGRAVSVPVTYDGEDIEEVCRLSGLGRDALIRAHSGVEYTVAFVGFMPGFAYLIGGDPRLEIPRRSSPRTRVPQGAVAIAGPYSAVYPRASPGGWSLLGRTALGIFDPERPEPALLQPGDRVRFEPL
jgi:KipI family sensor histidine kinase inhibitor